MSNRFSLTLSVLLGLGFTSLAAAQNAAPMAERTEGCHCQELRFTLKPGSGHNFVLPVTQSPVHIEVSFTGNNGGTQEPSELMYAVVNQDPSSKQLTWIGTNSDGSQSGSSSLKGKTIASIFGGGPSTTNASLVVVAAPTRAVAVTQNANTTSIPGQYVVRIYF